MADASEAVVLLRDYGIEVRPSWLPFTPWTTIDDLVDLVDFVVAHDLVPNVDPVQYTVRLLVPEGSLLLGRTAMTPHLGPLRPDPPGLDVVASRSRDRPPAAGVGGAGRRRASSRPRPTRSGRSTPDPCPGGDLSGSPSPRGISNGPVGERARLTEPWFCCSEPTAAQLAPLGSP